MAARASDDFLAQRIDDLRAEMRVGFDDIRAEIRTLHARVDTLFLALVVGLLGIVGTLVVKL
jgi:hypothetical protein